METQNLSIWEQVREVPKEAQKPFDNGSFKGTDINPTWRLKKLTEVFGPVGKGWYYNILEHWNEQIGDEIHTHVKVALFVNYDGQWSAPIEGIGGNKSYKVTSKGGKPSDEGYKMALTDALSVACKSLGIGADIYWQNDPTKYSEYEVKSNAPAPQNKPQEKKPTNVPEKKEEKASKAEKSPLDIACEAVENCNTSDELVIVWNKYKGQFGENPTFVSKVQKSPVNPNKK